MMERCTGAHGNYRMQIASTGKRTTEKSFNFFQFSFLVFLSQCAFCISLVLFSLVVQRERVVYVSL